MRHQRTLDWFLQSHWKRNILRTQGRLGYYDNVLWQCYEIRERFLAYKSKFAKTYEISIDALNSPVEIQRMFRKLGVSYTPFRELACLAKNSIEMDDEEVWGGVLRDWNKSGVREFSVFPETIPH